MNQKYRKYLRNKNKVQFRKISLKAACKLYPRGREPNVLLKTQKTPLKISIELVNRST